MTNPLRLLEYFCERAAQNPILYGLLGIGVFIGLLSVLP